MNTIGELRQYIQRTGATWKLPATFKDADPIPRHKTGGHPPKSAQQTKPGITIQDVLNIASNPTPNLLLRNRRVQSGLFEVADPSGRLKPRFIPGGSGSLPSALPSTVDWRNRFGFVWTASIQDQGCQDCWAFATTALVETMARIEHCIWAKRSEVQVRHGVTPNCCTCGNDMENALQWIGNNGVCDEICSPYTTDDAAMQSCCDLAARTVQINYANAQFMTPSTVAGHEYDVQKSWLDFVGPLVMWLDASMIPDAPITGVFNSFNTCNPSASNNTCDGHFMLIVGYDDTQTPPCWIVRNSWGTTFGENGYFYMAYGAANSDTYHHMGVTLTVPDPWSKRRQHSGSTIESENGTLHCNFELVATTAQGANPLQSAHWSRDGSSLAWTVEETFANDVASFPTLTQTTFNRNFECVHVTPTGLLHHWYFDRTNNAWNDGGTFGPGTAVGRAGFIQGNYGCPGNFEVVVATTAGALQHLWRDNGNAPCVWNTGETFGANIQLSGASLVQSHYGVQGNFELVATLTSGAMQHFWRDNDNGGVWHAGEVFGQNITGSPCMIEGQYGATNETAIGNFELCVANSANAVEHWYRDNVNGGVWHQASVFGDQVKDVVSLLQGSYGFNLEIVVLRTDGRLQEYYRDQNLVWHVGSIFGSA